MSRKTWILTAVVLASGTVFLDGTVVNVALPQMGKELSRSFLGLLEGQTYVYYGYLLTLSAFLILAGALSDFYGRKRLFTIGVGGFAVTSMLCALAWNMEVLVAFRLLQGVAGAILIPGSLAILTASFEGEEQGRAFGIWAGASSAVTILGPAIGGAVVTYISWRAVFFINIPLLALALYATVKYIDESRDDEAPAHFDWLGAVVIALALGGVTFGLIRGEVQRWEDSVAFTAIGVGLLATFAFPFLMRMRKNPLVPLGLFRSRNFSVTNISTLIIYGALYVTFQYLALFSIGTLGYNGLGFGLAGIPGSLFLVLFSSKVGALAGKYGPRVFMAVGPAVMGVGLLWLARVPADSTPWQATLGDISSFVPPTGYLVDILPGLIVFGIGLTIMVAPLTTALMRSVEVRHSGLASAVNNAISRVGPQLIGAALFIALSTNFYAAMEERVPSLDVASSEVREDISPLNQPQNASPEVVQAAKESSTEAFRVAMFVSAMACLLGAAVNAVGIRNEQLVGHDEAGRATEATEAAEAAATA
jgi:EmrB/QacA subfamily drug resistance transporter